ncbi:MAG TPA: N-acetylmuramoyl-L-alanine amidase [Kofleriaceae bacterium]|nr:N-acetylmuramoyl-L-alanine amidase [Kofleriaceae bacterium]
MAATGHEARTSPSPGDGPEPPSRFDSPAITPKPGAGSIAPEDAAAPPVRRVRQELTRRGAARPGALSGKTVYLSAGHGWTWSGGAWRTQRGNTNGLVEDFITAEGVNQYLVAYLRNMGAYVVPIRESDLSTVSVAVDDDEAILEGDAAGAAAGDTGWAPFAPPIDAAVRPFSRGTARTMTAAAEETGRAVFPFAVPESGTYNVYVSWVQGPDRAPDAHVIVRHGGGTSHLRVDQRRHGSTWVLLGRWWFDADAPLEESSVVFANDSESPGALVSFDAVRIGGGVAVHDVGGGTNGRPAFEQSSRYSTQLLGAPPDVYDYFQGDDSDDVVARPRFAAWEHESGEDAIYLAWHTNAPNPGRGTLSIVYGPQYPCCGGLGEFTGTAGSLELLHAVHDEVVADLRAAWDPDWPNQGKVTASLGELRPSHNGEMPAILVEVAYHDTPADANALRAPEFRRIAARAMAQGVARYFAAADGRPLVLAPEPPSALRVQNDGAGGLRVSWRPPAAAPGGGDAPEAYRVYVSKNGHGFDDGALVEDEEVVLDGLSPGDVRYVRVASVNAGGESLPSEVVGARVATSGQAPILVVNGFDRLDAFQSPRSDLAQFGLGLVDRMWLDRMNDGSYAVRHGAALAAAGFAFDGASDEAIAQEDVDLAAYQAVDWFAGEDSIGQDPLPVAVRAAIERLQAAGGALLLSGSEVVWALADQGSPEDQAFALDVLRVGLTSDDADTYDVMPLDGPMADLAPLSFDDTGPGGYDADYPDVLAPAPDATPILAYAGGQTAAVAWGLGSGGARGIVLGFPLEVVSGHEARTALLGTAMALFGIEPEPAGPDGDGDGEPDGEDPELADLAGGCGCRAGGEGSAAPLLLALALLAGATRRRRRSAR